MTDQLPEKRLPSSEIIFYQTADGRTRIEVRFQEETVWLSQKLLAELFQKDIRTINEHIINIYEEGELSPEPTIRKFRIVQKEGPRQVAREVDFYNLDMIISIGYRVKSHRGYCRESKGQKVYSLADQSHRLPGRTLGQAGQAGDCR